jgi:hypothetical protein
MGLTIDAVDVSGFWLTASAHASGIAVASAATPAAPRCWQMREVP